VGVDWTGIDTKKSSQYAYPIARIIFDMHSFSKLPKNKKMLHASPGTFLLAGGALRDPNFARSVILLCEHNEEGSFGLVLNQPLPISLADGFSRVTDWDTPLYKGGPVQTSSLSFIHTRSDIDTDSQEIVPGVFWGGSFELVDELMCKGVVQPQEFRFFAGYSGWGELQLQGEIDRNDWYLMPADAESIFLQNSAEHWSRIMRRMGPEYALFANLPLNPQHN